jgi:polyisoprenoid-binding protein YceI
MLALGMPPVALAATETYTIDPAHTMPGFEVSHLGISTQRGRFERTAGTIALDREAGSGAVAIEIDAASVTTGTSKLDVTVRGEDFLDAANHPHITFHAERFKFEKDVPVSAEGELTLLGVTKPVTLSITHFACTRKPFLVRTTCGADASATISRSAFGMSRFASFLGDDVRIVIQVEAVKEEAAAAPTSSGG